MLALKHAAAVENTSTHFFYLSTKWTTMVRMIWLLYSWHPLSRRLGGAHSQFLWGLEL